VDRTLARDLLNELRRRLEHEPDSERPVEPHKLVCFVLDDEKGIRRLVSLQLRQLGHHTEDFGSIEAMAEALARSQPDLIFLDVALERSDAVDALRVLSQRGFAGVIQLMSGRHPGLIEEVKAVGENRALRMLPVLQKPFRSEEIRNVIHRYHHGFASKPEPAIFGGAERPSPRIELTDALRQGWLELWYQPKFDLRAKTLAGAEGLVRARHPVHSLLPPAAFLPGADEASLLSLTEHVIAMALQDWQLLPAPIIPCVSR
jgi:CheY-like chemotaxis protein